MRSWPIRWVVLPLRSRAWTGCQRSAEEETLPAALLIHDGGDRRVPSWLGARLAAAWPCARLHVTRGLGHHRILHDDGVIAASVDFLMAGAGC